MSKMVDVGNLPRRLDPKRPMVDFSSSGKAPVVELNLSPVENLSVVLPPDVPSSEAPLYPDPEPSTAPPAKNPTTTSHTLLMSEAMAWNMCKTVVKEDNVMACYDMSVKEFECSTIHDLFKVFSSSIASYKFLF